MFTSLLLAMFFQYYPHTPPAVAATAPNPDYPLHIRILSTHWNWFRQEGVHGYGRANLLTLSPKGVEFTYSCEQPFMQNTEPGEFYQAKWRKPDQELTLLLQKVGSNKTTKCDVKVALHDAPYGHPANATGPTSSTQPARPAAAGALSVLDTTYRAESDTVTIRLQNQSDQIITAFNVQVSLTAGSSLIRRFDYSDDVLEPFLTAQCQPGSTGVGDGAVKPGQVFTLYLPAYADKAKLTGEAPVVQSQVTEFISSNGAVQVNQDNPTTSMKSILYNRDEASVAEGKFVSILNSHEDDPDIQHRLAAITEAAKLQEAIAPKATASQESAKTSRDMGAIGSSALNQFLVNLQLIAASSNPKEVLDAFTSLMTCRQQRRTAMYAGADVSKSQQ